MENATKAEKFDGAASGLTDVLGLESASMDIADRLHGYAMLHKGMTPESWAMAEGRDEIIGLRQIVSAQRDLIAALDQVANLSITAMAENARSVFDVAQIERTLKVLAAAKAACLAPNAAMSGEPKVSPLDGIVIRGG